MNIIVIDDDAAFRRSAEILLENLGHRVRCYADPAYVASGFDYGEAVDVLVLDYMLADSTGLDFLRRMKGRLAPSCRVILISGHTDLTEPLDLRAWGVQAFLPKPLDYDRFCALIDPQSMEKSSC